MFVNLHKFAYRDRLKNMPVISRFCVSSKNYLKINLDLVLILFVSTFVTHIILKFN